MVIYIDLWLVLIYLLRCSSLLRIVIDGRLIVCWWGILLRNFGCDGCVVGIWVVLVLLVG